MALFFSERPGAFSDRPHKETRPEDPGGERPRLLPSRAPRIPQRYRSFGGATIIPSRRGGGEGRTGSLQTARPRGSRESQNVFAVRHRQPLMVICIRRGTAMSEEWCLAR
ncbi:unnamed protein product, partial [Nesidiocoris tenuis]